jgi:FAD/FMN-containing dehydrogenase
MGKIDQAVIQELQSHYGNRVSFDSLERKIYAHDMGTMPSMIKPLAGDPVPDGIVQPVSEEELVELVKLARQKKINLTPRARRLPVMGAFCRLKAVGGGVQPHEQNQRH